eukprot:6118272-Prymnesium_polylepis.1
MSQASATSSPSRSPHTPPRPCPSTSSWAASSLRAAARRRNPLSGARTHALRIAKPSDLTFEPPLSAQAAAQVESSPHPNMAHAPP